MINMDTLESIKLHVRFKSIKNIFYLVIDKR